MSTNFRSKHPLVYNHKRLMELTGVQYKIWDYTIHGTETLRCKGTGICFIGTNQFAGIAPQEIIRDELGRTDKEVSLALYNKEVPLTDEQKKKKIGNLVANFPDIIEYDPEHDIINNKLMFEYCGILYLTTAKAKIDGIHSDYQASKYKAPERWWGEFMYKNKARVSEAWSEWIEIDREKPHKNGDSIKKTFAKLFELEREFSPSSIPSKIVSVEKIKQVNEMLAKI